MSHGQLQLLGGYTLDGRQAWMAGPHAACAGGMLGMPRSSQGCCRAVKLLEE